jgi:hypothetical protein
MLASAIEARPDCEKGQVKQLTDLLAGIAIAESKQ